MASPVHHLVTLGPRTNLALGQSEDVVQGDGSGGWWSGQDCIDSAGESIAAIMFLIELTYQFTMSSFVEVRLFQLHLALTLTNSTMILPSKTAIGNNGWWMVSHVC